MSREPRACIAVLALLGAPGPALAQQYDNRYDQAAGYGVETLEARVEKLEKRLSGRGLADVVNDIEKLQSEVRKLRGDLEKADDELDRLKKDRKEDYATLDQRLQQLTAVQTQLQAQAQAQAAAVQAAAAQAAQPAPPDASGQVSGSSAEATTPNSGQSAAQAPTEPAAPSAPPPASTREADYQKAFATLKEGKYPEAIKEFKNFLSTYPSGEFSDNAQYWLAEAYYVTKDLGSAHEAFGNVIKTYPQSAKVSDAMLKSGFIEYDTGQYAAARDILTELMKRYPGSSAAKLADKRLEKMRQENR